MKLRWWHIGLLLSLMVALLSPLASSSPDGLEKVAEEKGFIGEARRAPYQVIVDYVFPGVANEALATILAGIIGTGLVFGAAFGVSRLLRVRRREKRHEPQLPRALQ